ncbi:DUF881 domain-containing protein [Streptomyces sp. NP160]|uniref:DUF881 domain-containing protein n=1 Tax=Streptomyces sp. NP160 TaxID=2586637 RepID=UPI00111A3150|nr:DUF881 domain-containing protein [Streptomyces sp. NP160]TNM59399.1 DUF881 domain-containing protein [Streptomyces sp. NP160]
MTADDARTGHGGGPGPEPDPPAAPGPGQLALDLPAAGGAGSADQLLLDIPADDDERGGAAPGAASRPGSAERSAEEPAAAPAPAEPAPAAPAAAPAPAAPAPAEPAPAAPAGHGTRRGLRYALAPRATRGQLVVGLLCLLLGLAVAVQVQQRTGADLAALPQPELLGLLDDATDRSERLQREISDLESAQQDLRASGDQQAAARELAQQRVDTLGILAGTLPATGPGIRLTVQVPSGSSPSAATLLLGAVQELRDAGAEAIQIGDARVIASSAFTDSADGAVAVGGPGTEVLVRAPFTVLAIGGPQTLASAMEFPDGVGPTVRRVGGSISVEQLDAVDVTALQPAGAPAYARTVAPSAPG